MEWLLIALILATGAALTVLPNISRPTVPLGVSVPRARVDEPVVRRQVRLYRTICVSLTLVTAAGTAASGPSIEVSALAGPRSHDCPARHSAGLGDLPATESRSDRR